MLKSFGKIAVFCVVAGLSLLFATNDCYAQKIEAVSGKDFINRTAQDGSVKKFFTGTTKKIPCGSTEQTCDAASQICLRCTRTYKKKVVGIRVASGVEDEGKCISASGFNPAKIKQYWPECAEGEGNNKFAGTGKEFEQKLTVSENGFISTSKRKTIGIKHSEHTESFVGTDNKKYTLFMTTTDEGPIPTINYAEEGFQGCEVLPVKIYNMQSCFFCPMARILFKAANDATRSAFDNFANSFIILIVVVYAVWLAYVSLQQVFPFTKKDAADFIEIILKQSFKFAIAYYLLVNATTLFKLFIGPVLQSGLRMGEMIQDGDLLQMAKKINTPDATIGGDYYNVTYANGNTLFVQIESYLSAIQAQMSYMQAIGTSLFCVGSKQMIISIVPLRFEVALAIRMMFLGAILCVFGFIISIVFAYYFLDAILQLGLLGVMMPLMIAGWPFKLTAKYASTGLSFLLNTFFIFFFTGFVISVCVVLVYQSISMSNQIETQADDGSTGFGAIVKAMNEQNIKDLDRATDIGGIGFLLLAFASLFGFKFIEQVQPLATKLSGGAITGMASQIGTMGMSTLKGMAQKATAPARKAVSKKWNENGGIVGYAAKGVSKTAHGLGRAASFVGLKKPAKALYKVASGAGKVQQAMAEVRQPDKNKQG